MTMKLPTLEAPRTDDSGARIALLAVQNLQVVYGGAIEAVRDVSLEVHAGTIVALLGSNGAGKSTVLKAISAVLDAEDGEVEKGAILFDRHAIESWKSDHIVAQGLVQVPEGRRLFASLTVEENLTVGAHLKSGIELNETRRAMYELFPRLADRRTQIAGYLSGGEQQMVAIARALMSRPRLLALDEPSLGLAPLIVAEIFEAIAKLRRDSGMTILLVEQNATRALAVADYAYIMENGRVVLDGTPQALSKNADVREFYLGLGASNKEGTSMRDVKHYKRRKRWLS
ncbi:MAG: ABC transporter ATP-binding protein [Sulfuricaulis sp.]|nr:ABC transporter ATP-binding protein [Sulfuricaulis sp.]